MTAQLQEAAFAVDLPLELPVARTRRASRRALVRRVLAAADGVALLTAFTLTVGLLGPIESSHGSWTELALFTVTLPLWLAVAALYGLYRRDAERTDHTTVDDAAPVFHLVTTGAWLTFVLLALPAGSDPDLGRTVAFWGIAFASVLTVRAAARTACRRNPAFRQNAIVVGTDAVGQSLARKLTDHPECGIDIVGFVDTQRRDAGGHLLGYPERLPELVHVHDVERVIFAFAEMPLEQSMDLMRTLSQLGLQVDVVPRFYDVVSSGMDSYSVEGVPLLGIRPVRLSAPARLTKRAIDLTGSALALLLVGPLMLAVAILIKLDSPGPVFFRQRRIGAGNRSFRIWKFRTMFVDADERKAALAHLNQHARNGDGRLFKIVDDPRVTRAGRFLRRHYLDEFPQLINVFRGDMSLVGPRPLIPDEAQHVDEWALERLNLKPGMTGLWQVLGGSAISFGEMVKLDYLYVTTWSLWNDIRLLAQTVPVVFRGSRAHH